MKFPLRTKHLTDAEYKEQWASLEPIEIRMVEKRGECKHDVGDTFTYENPYIRPQGVCPALLNVLDLYTWRVSLDFPSWNANDRAVYRLHCPDATGTVGEMQKAEK
jgi:uncharacterized repeat protein (TIGR04076 family)